METKTSILLDIFLKERFVCQMKYETSETVVLEDGSRLPLFDMDVVKLFVEIKKPSLRGKDYRISPSKQRV